MESDIALSLTVGNKSPTAKEAILKHSPSYENFSTDKSQHSESG